MADGAICLRLGIYRTSTSDDQKEQIMRKRFEIGGFIAAAVLIAFGIGAIGMGLNARSTTRCRRNRSSAPRT